MRHTELSVPESWPELQASPGGRERVSGVGFGSEGQRGSGESPEKEGGEEGDVVVRKKGVMGRVKKGCRRVVWCFSKRE
jgi:hypothetical protein